MLFPKANYLIKTKVLICDMDRANSLYLSLPSKTLICQPLESKGGFLEVLIMDMSDKKYYTYYLPAWNVVSILEVSN